MRRANQDWRRDLYITVQQLTLIHTVSTLHLRLLREIQIRADKLGDGSVLTTTASLLGTDA